MKNGETMERRTFEVSELRLSGGGDKPSRIDGLAAPYNSPSKLLRTAKGQPFVEVLLPGAFDDCLGDDVRCLFNHDDSRILGRSTAGTLALTTSERGLEYSCELPETSYAADLSKSIARGDVRGCSFAFAVADEGQSFRNENGTMIREIRKVSRLFDVSPVTNPAYEQTEVVCRSVDAAAEELLEPVREGHEKRAMDVCPQCGAEVSPDTPRCPLCGAQAHAGYCLCGACGGFISAGQRFCDTCGMQVPQQTVTCGQCGVRVTDGAAFCPLCGASLAGDSVDAAGDRAADNLEAEARQKLAELL